MSHLSFQTQLLKLQLFSLPKPRSMATLSLQRSKSKDLDNGVYSSVTRALIDEWVIAGTRVHFNYWSTHSVLYHRPRSETFV